MKKKKDEWIRVKDIPSLMFVVLIGFPLVLTLNSLEAVLTLWDRFKEIKLFKVK